MAPRFVYLIHNALACTEDRRMLTKSKYSKKIERKLADKNLIDCDQCQTYECFVDEEDLDDNAQNQEEIDNYISGWIEELAGCQATGVQWNEMDVYTGVMCSPYGDGVELAVFLDEDCSLYTNQLAFTDVFNPYADQDNNDNNIDYFTSVEGYIKSAFSEVSISSWSHACHCPLTSSILHRLPLA